MDILDQLHGAHWADASERLRLVNLAADEIERLREALQDIREVYAGSEGIPKPMTAAEGYLLERLMEAVRIAARALAGKIEEVSDA